MRPVVANAIDTVGRHRGGANEGDTPKGLDGRAGSGAGMQGKEWRRDGGLDRVKRARSEWNRERSDDGLDPVYRKELLDLTDEVLREMRE
mgnify:CR=1 FL=1